MPENSTPKAQSKSKLAQHLLVSFGLSTLLMAYNWARVVDPGFSYYFHGSTYFYKLACLTLHLILVVAVFALYYAPKPARVAFGIIVVPFVLNSVRLAFSVSPTSLFAPKSIVFVVASLITAFVVVRRLKLRASEIVKFGWTLASCIGAVTILSALVSDPQPIFTEIREPSTKNAPRSVVVVIFDELDPLHALENWPKDRKPNAFQVSAERGLFFQNVSQPGIGTIVSIPAILYGNSIEFSKPTGPSSLLVKDKTGSRKFETKGTFLETVPSQWPLNILGWFHPYDRIFPYSQAVKSWDIEPLNFSYAFKKAVHLIYDAPLRMLGFATHIPGLKAELAQHHQSIVAEYRDSVRKWSADPTGFSFLHVPSPHGPFVKGDYYDSVAEAGEILDDIEVALRQSQKPYLLIVGSDHELREELNGLPRSKRIPLIIMGTGILPQNVKDIAFGENIFKLATRGIAGNWTQADLVRAATEPRQK